MNPKQWVYLVSTRWVKTARGWKDFCQVFYQWWDDKNFQPEKPDDITEFVAMEMRMPVKNGSMEIHYWSGTGFTRIEQRLREKFGKDTKVFNVSVFNQ